MGEVPLKDEPHFSEASEPAAANFSLRQSRSLSIHLKKVARLHAAARHLS